MSLRKAAKANWHWDCRTCDYTSPRSPDRYGAELYGWDHEQTAEHVGKALIEVFAPIQEAVTDMVDAYWEMARGVIEGITDAMDQMAYALAPPPNIPHDPSLRKDKRKWGGR